MKCLIENCMKLREHKYNDLRGRLNVHVVNALDIVCLASGRLTTKVLIFDLNLTDSICAGEA